MVVAHAVHPGRRARSLLRAAPRRRRGGAVYEASTSRSWTPATSEMTKWHRCFVLRRRRVSTVRRLGLVERVLRDIRLWSSWSTDNAFFATTLAWFVSSQVSNAPRSFRHDVAYFVPRFVFFLVPALVKITGHKHLPSWIISFACFVFDVGLFVTDTRLTRRVSERVVVLRRLRVGRAELPLRRVVLSGGGAVRRRAQTAHPFRDRPHDLGSDENGTRPSLCYRRRRDRGS